MALESLRENGFQLQKKSGTWRSPAWPPGSDQPDYLNAVIMGEYDGSAVELLALLHEIEAKQGRVRSIPNAARTLDLDLLIFGSEVHDTDDLKLPHPRMRERAFVLIPAAELQSKWLKDIAKLSQDDIQLTRYAGPW